MDYEHTRKDLVGAKSPPLSAGLGLSCVLMQLRVVDPHHQFPLSACRVSTHCIRISLICEFFQSVKQLQHTSMAQRVSVFDIAIEYIRHFEHLEVQCISITISH